MTGVITIAGVCTILAGLLQIFARDMAWKSAQASNRRRGAVSERTPEWEISSILQGIMGVLAGISLIWIASLSGHSQPQRHETVEIPVHERRYETNL